MDQRIVKTKEAIHQAFYQALKKKDYSAITIQDILDEAKISRSAFYAHFKSKEEVLLSIISDIFDHVFSHHLEEEKTHDFSHSSILDYWEYIEHYLYHLEEEKDLINAVLSNSCREIVMQETEEKIAPLAMIIVGEQKDRYEGLPASLSADMVKETIIKATEYWLKNGCQETPETIVDYIKKLSGCR
jgi:AcrR family transcriptional regulator